ncbi:MULTISPECIES: cytochrome c biogenesis CcdA family protein [Paraburkholderia]|uniref:Cytochrome c biogenesis protein CcdA n=1 Tax=Paraburkholderia podalyriae TaxID=1938811 RepID=A0ABR7Q2I0_9BURK|nr:cytochrome c biogenesis protein CcdA [Paraburkholderia podalyriae]MBC8752728.1 cytochrome c biogenesis protein CcdA [Paraburkholderia podalyriae]
MSLGFALLAGVLSTLSPCVLPLLPMMLGTAVAEHRLGPAALAAGLAFSFVAVGLFVATIGFSLGLDVGVFRSVGAVLLTLIGLVLLMPRLQARVAVAAGPLSNWSSHRFRGARTGGLSGQFGVGLVLGAVWSPCVGPTLGAASLLAAQGQDLGQVALTMLMFGLGAALPLMLLGALSREALIRWRQRLLTASSTGKMVLGVMLVMTGVSIFSGLDKALEAALVSASPRWLTDITTRF